MLRPEDIDAQPPKPQLGQSRANGGSDSCQAVGADEVSGFQHVRRLGRGLTCPRHLCQLLGLGFLNREDALA